MIGRTGLVSPVIFRNNITGASYLEFLPIVRVWPDFEELVFMQDGAPPQHTAAKWLNEHFPACWMGRSSVNLAAPISWPPYSPDLTPCDFFLWGVIREKVYRTQPTDLNDLERRIRQAFEELPQIVINRAVGAFERRLERRIEVNGKSVGIY